MLARGPRVRTTVSCRLAPLMSSSSKVPVPDAGLDVLVLRLVKLGIDRRSEFILRRAVMECLNAALKHASEQTVSTSDSSFEDR